MKKTVVGLGEILWDILPDATHLGGAPANFAYVTSLMGDRGVVASRVGADARGKEARRKMEALGLPVTFLQTDPDKDHPTGTAQARVDGNGQASFVIAQPAAWDFMEWTAQWQELAKEADAVCFGSLAQRLPQSRETIRKFVRATSRDAVRVFDVNLRGDFYSRELLAESMSLADIVKVNDEELPTIMKLGGLVHSNVHSRDHGGEKLAAEKLLRLYDLKVVCITRGDRGSLLVSKTGSSEHAGFRVQVADTIGAGDAFTAGLTHEYLHGTSLDRMNEVANRVGAWVASQAGATPTPKDGALQNSLAEIS
ncbi:MAG: carbohydrate kinase [Candidatus Sulfotelmatobacter sp.]